jgi:hypothetical protein
MFSDIRVRKIKYAVKKGADGRAVLGGTGAPGARLRSISATGVVPVDVHIKEAPGKTRRREA